jgi:hypothetical protein
VAIKCKFIIDQNKCSEWDVYMKVFSETDAVKATGSADQRESKESATRGWITAERYPECLASALSKKEAPKEKQEKGWETSQLSVVGSSY